MICCIKFSCDTVVIFKGYLIYLLFYFRGGREEEREGEKYPQEKQRSVAFCMRSDQGWNLQPRHTATPGIEPVTFCFAG